MESEKSIQLQVTADSQTAEVDLRERTVLVPFPHGGAQEVHLYRCARGEEGKVINAAEKMFLVDENADARFWGMNIQALKGILNVHPIAAKERAGEKSNAPPCKFLDPRITSKMIHDREGGRTRAQVVADMRVAAEEASTVSITDLRKRLSSGDVTGFPDEVYNRMMAAVIRPGGDGFPEDYGEFKNELLDLCHCGDYEQARRKLSNAQKSKKSKSSSRRDFAKLFRVELQDLWRYYLYEQGMREVHRLLRGLGHCSGPYDSALYRFFHYRHEYLDGLVPVLHPVAEILSHWQSFLIAAIRRFEADAESMTSDVLADFYGRLPAAFQAFACHTEIVRDRDQERKKREREQKKIDPIDPDQLGQYDPERDLDNPDLERER